MMLDALFINPDYKDAKNYPWGLLNLASYLSKAKGRRVKLIDASVHGSAKTLELIKRHLPETRLVGIGFMSIDAKFAKETADFIKRERPGCHVIAGGPHPTLLPEQTALYPSFDSVSYTEAEVTVERLIKELGKDAPDLAAVPGLVFRRDGELVKTAAAQPVDFYDIDYDLLHEDIQKSFGDYIQVFTGFGCSFKCTFCFNAICGSAWRGRPMEEVFAELSRLVGRYDPKTVYFRDENFFHDRKRILDFIRLYRENGFTFKWRALCRASYFNDHYMGAAFLKELASVGCTCLKYGFESGSDRVLRSLRKGITVKNIERVYEAHGAVPEIQLVGNFMMGMPGETPDDYKATLNLIGKGLREVPGMDVVGPHYFRIYPGGVLYNSLISDFGYVPLESFEAWAERYSDDDTRGFRSGFADTAQDYPWVPKSCEFLTKNASFLARLARIDYIRLQPPYKRWLFWPIYALMRLRLRSGYYGALADLRLALWLQKASIWNLLENSSFFRRLRNLEGYRKLRQTGAFSRLKGIFQKTLPGGSR